MSRKTSFIYQNHANKVICAIKNNYDFCNSKNVHQNISIQVLFLKAFFWKSYFYKLLPFNSAVTDIFCPFYHMLLWMHSADGLIPLISQAFEGSREDTSRKSPSTCIFNGRRSGWEVCASLHVFRDNFLNSLSAA